jgi:hypothetical protein
VVQRELTGIGRFTVTVTVTGYLLGLKGVGFFHKNRERDAIFRTVGN